MSNNHGFSAYGIGDLRGVAREALGRLGAGEVGIVWEKSGQVIGGVLWLDGRLQEVYDYDDVIALVDRPDARRLMLRTGYGASAVPEEAVEGIAMYGDVISVEVSR